LICLCELEIVMRSFVARLILLLLTHVAFVRAAEIDPAVMEVGRVQFMMCAACHGKEGEGTAAAPPLAGSEWVGAAAENLIRIQLRGLHGPITVKGREYDIAGGMAPMAYQRDEQIAAVLTYVRQSFGNDAPPVQASEVAALRGEVGKPQLTVADLVPHGQAAPAAVATPSNKYANLDECESFPRWVAIGIIVALLAGVGLWLAKSK
jgi:mono/diheme cytochrome c family protein